MLAIKHTIKPSNGIVVDPVRAVREVKVASSAVSFSVWVISADLSTMVTLHRPDSLIAPLFFFHTHSFTPLHQLHRNQLVAQVSTMQENAQHRVFAIPELLALIAQCLSPRDISQWMLTCKAFSRRLEPYFWSYPVIRRDRFQLPHLARYTHHFRSLEASLDISLSLVQSVSLSPTQTTSHRLVMPEFPRLRTLTVHAYHIKDAIFLLQSRLVLYSPTLTELNLQFSFESDSLLVEHYLDLLATNLPCLQNLVCLLYTS